MAEPFILMLAKGAGGFSIFIYIILGIIVVGGFSVIIWDIKKYNKRTRIFCLRGGKYTCYETKGSKETNKKNVTVFKTKSFGRDNEHIERNNLSNELYYEMENNLLKMPFLPKVLVECVDFMSPKKGVYVPVRRSFISFRRGEELNIGTSDECVCCKENIDIKEYIKNPHDAIKKFDTICESCLSDLINVRYECIDDADLAYYWSVIDEIDNKYGNFINKYGVIITSIACLVLVGFVIYVINRYYPDMQNAVSATHNQAYQTALTEQVNAMKYNNTLPTN